MGKRGQTFVGEEDLVVLLRLKREQQSKQAVIRVQLTGSLKLRISAWLGMWVCSGNGCSAVVSTSHRYATRPESSNSRERMNPRWLNLTMRCCSNFLIVNTGWFQTR